jgi:hypothetical protein
VKTRLSEFTSRNQSVEAGFYHGHGYLSRECGR